MSSFQHYSALARQLSPADLAKAAARRAFRTARKALHRRVEGPGEEEVLAAYRAQSEEELVAQALLQPSLDAWCDIRQRPDVVYALTKVPGARGHALDRAGEAASRSFRVFGLPVCFGPEGDIDWNWGPNRDPKYPWVLGRLDQLIALGQGYWGSQSYSLQAFFARQFVAQVADFLDKNPPAEGVHWACPMEIALRAANVAQALRMFGDAPEILEPGFLLDVLVSLTQHSAYVEAHLEDDVAVPNNHLVANLVGLLVVSALFPELPGASRRMALATRGLRTQMQEQVLEDGYSFEGSVPYHRLSLELFTLAFVTAKAHRIDLGTDYAERLVRMFQVAHAYCSEDGWAPQIGDNDSGRALPFCERPSLDHGYLPALGAALFGKSDLKREGAVFPEEALWLLGESGRARFEALESRAETRGFSSPKGGLHVLRVPKVMVAVSAGPNGQRGVGGHSHNDKLSFELHVDGTPLIVDPGTGSYTGNPMVRDALRSTSAHNTVQVSGLEQAPVDSTRLFALPDTAKAMVLQLGPHTLTASHRGFPGIEVIRTFELVPSRRIVRITDVVKGKGRHKLVSRLHLADGEIRFRPPTEAEVEVLEQGQRKPERVTELGPQDAPRAVIISGADASVEIAEAVYSPGYGEVVPAACWVSTWEGDLPHTLSLVISYA